MSVGAAKYVIFESGLDETPIVFPSPINHASMAMMMGSWSPVSAGFVTFGLNPKDDSIVAHCYGKSVGLGLQAREQDSEILTRAFCD